MIYQIGKQSYLNIKRELLYQNDYNGFLLIVNLIIILIVLAKHKKHLTITLK